MTRTKRKSPRASSTSEEKPSPQGSTSEEKPPQSIQAAFLDIIWRHPRLRIPLILFGALAVSLSVIWASLPETYKAGLLARLGGAKHEAEPSNEGDGQTRSANEGDGQPQPANDPMATYRSDSFYIEEKMLTLDLSSWTKVAENISDHRVSPAKWNTTSRMRRVSDAQKDFVKVLYTTGLTPEAVCFTHPFTLSELPYTLRPGLENLLKYGLIIDLSSENLGEVFEMRYQTIFWNSFQGETGDWAVALINNPTKSVVFTIIFPRFKPFKSYELFASSERATRTERFLDEPDISLAENGRILTWRIHDPILNYQYRVAWAW